MKQWEHAIEVLEEVLEERKSFVFGREWFEDTTDEDIPEDFRFPVLPFVVVLVDSVLDCFLKRSISCLLVDPFNAFTGEYGEGRG